MKEITLSIIYEIPEELDIFHQLKIAQCRYVPKNIKVTDVSFEREWLGNKSKITFKGVES